MTNNPKFILSVDLDWVPGSDSPMLNLFEIFEKQQIKPAMFFTAGYAQNYPHLAKTALELKYEIGTHGMLHGFDWQENFGLSFSKASKNELLIQSSKILADIFGFQPIMFRAPFLNISEDTLEVLVELGYKIDSSIPAKRFDFFRGSVNSLKYFASSSAPYLIKTNCGNILEIPPSALILPLNMRLLTMFGVNFVVQFTKILSHICPYLVFYLHPTEFISSDKLTLTNGYPAKFFQHCHKNNLILLNNYITRLKQNGFQFVQISELSEQYPAISKL